MEDVMYTGSPNTERKFLAYSIW